MSDGIQGPKRNRHENGYGAISTDFRDEQVEEGKQYGSSSPYDNNGNRYERSTAAKSEELPRKVNRWYMVLLGLLMGILLVGLIFRSSTHTKTRDNGSSPSSAKEEPRTYDYIVVGGGPSGIITATKLAKRLPEASVLLIESGTVSQSSVLEALEEKTEKMNDTDAMEIDQSGAVLSETALNEAPSSSKRFQLNKYDIPLFWSGVATVQRRTQERFQLKPDPKTSTYWPIPLALLARGLGGCGLHDSMIYIRSLPSCFAKWNLTNTGKNPWTFDQMLSVYKELERYSPAPGKRIVPNFRGDSGPMYTMSSGPEADVMGDYFLGAARTSGVPRAHDGFNHPNASDRVGMGYYEFNIHNGMRHSVVKALLGSKEKIPSNLKILTGITVTEVLFDKTTAQRPPKARGVSCMDVTNHNARSEIWLKNKDKGNREKKTKAVTSEVILATGAIMTPQLLWNSGIGDNGTLADVPGVGKNLQDHPVLGMAYQISSDMTKDAPQMHAAADEIEDYSLAVQVLNAVERLHNASQLSETTVEMGREDALMREKEFASGQLGILGTSGFSTGGFLRSPWAEEIGGEVAPDIQLTVFPRVVEPHQPKSKNKADMKFMLSRSMLVTVALLQPEARYQVRPSELRIFTSNNTAKVDRERTVPYKTENPHADKIATTFAQKMQYALPSIELPDNRSEYLTDKDVNRLAWGMQQVRKIMKYRPMSDIIIQEMYPGPSVEDGEIMDQYIRVNHLANSHWVGSTKMGNDEDPMAVLDNRLRVRKVQGLRIFDSGAIPLVPNGDIHSTTCAVASRGVDLILEERQGL